MPKSILVPVNFSDVALQAVEHAIELAEIFDAEIVFYHAIDVPARTGILMDIEGRIMDDAREEMEAWKKKAVDTYDYEGSFASRISAGDLFHMTRQMTRSFDDCMVVMGTEGAKGIKEFLGSKAIGVIRTSHVPVYVVPDTADTFKLDHFLFTISRENDVGKSDLSIMQRLLVHFESKLTVLTIKKTEEEFIVDLEKVKNALEGYPFEMKEVISDDPIKSLDDRIDRGDIDLLCLIKVKRSLIERLFYRSRVRHEAFHSKIPLLVFQES